MCHFGFMYFFANLRNSINYTKECSISFDKAIKLQINHSFP